MAVNLDEDDDFGFHPGHKSKLGSLFATNENTNENDVNQSLTYVPPKQPKKDSSAYKSLKLIHTVAAFMYKLRNKEYEFQGKLGAAILGDNETSKYMLLIYKERAHRVATSVISTNFSFTILKDSYGRFSDDAANIWSIKFDSERDMIQFGKEIALAKINSTGEVPTSLTVQDLVPGVGPASKVGDVLDIIYTGWLFESKACGKVIDSNSDGDKAFSLELGRNTIMKGWHDGLVGSKLGCVRLLVIPPSLAYGEEGFESVVPPNAVLIFEIMVKKVIFRKEIQESTPEKSQSERKPEVPQRTASMSHDDSIRSRGASLSEQLTQSPRKDSRLINRMAKVGLPTLPMQNAISTHTASSDSDAEKEEYQRTMHRESSSSQKPPSLIQKELDKASPKLRIPSGDNIKNLLSKDSEDSSRYTMSEGSLRNIPLHNEAHMRGEIDAASVHSNTSSPFHTPSTVYPATMMNREPSPFHPQYQVPFQTFPSVMPTMIPVMDTYMSCLMDETRTKNEHSKFLLSNILEKVEKSNKMLEDMTLQTNLTSMGKIHHLESTVLAQSIDRIIKENVQLKEDNDTKATKLQELNDKLCDVLQRMQRDSSSSNKHNETVAVTISDLQEKLIRLEQNKASLLAELDEVKANASNKESEYLELCQKLLYLNEEKEHIAKSDETQSLLKQIDVFKQEKVTFVHDAKAQEDKLHQALKNEKVLETKIMELSNKLLIASEAEKQSQKMQQWKTKYDEVRNNTMIMKEQYENKIAFLTNEMKKLRDMPKASLEFRDEIKRVMNILNKNIKTQVNLAQSYTGEQVLELCLKCIMNVTMSMLEVGSSPPSPSPKKSHTESEKVNDPSSDREELSDQHHPVSLDEKVSQDVIPVSADAISNEVEVTILSQENQETNENEQRKEQEPDSKEMNVQESCIPKQDKSQPVKIPHTATSCIE